MDLLNRSDIQALAASEAEGPHVSLMLPTHRFGAGIQADQVVWKNLVNGAEALLLQDLRRADVDALLAPARELLNNNLAWQFMSDGLGDVPHLRQGPRWCGSPLRCPPWRRWVTSSSPAR